MFQEDHTIITSWIEANLKVVMIVIAKCELLHQKKYIYIYISSFENLDSCFFFCVSEGR